MQNHALIFSSGKNLQQQFNESLSDCKICLKLQTVYGLLNSESPADLDSLPFTLKYF